MNIGCCCCKHRQCQIIVFQQVPCEAIVIERSDSAAFWFGSFAISLSQTCATHLCPDASEGKVSRTTEAAT